MAQNSAAGGLDEEVAELHERHSAELLSYAASVMRSHDARLDAVQEVFLRYFVERSYGRKIEHPRAWLYRVLRNYLLDRMESACIKREVGAELAEFLTDQTHGPEQAVGDAQAARRFASLLTRREMECLRLRAEGMSYAEAAQVMRVRPGTVSALLTRVHKKFREAAGHDCQLGTVKALYALIVGG